MGPTGEIRALQPDAPLRPGEVKLTAEQARILLAMPRSARRAALAMGATANPRRQRALRARLLNLARRRGVGP